MKKLFIYLFYAATSSAYAQNESVDLFIKELSRCDGQYFKKIDEHKSELESLAPIRSLKQYSSFKVQDTKHPTNSRIIFKQPVNFAGLSVIGYFDEVIDLPKGMSSYSWGYLVSDNIQNTAVKLRSFIWDTMRLRDTGDYFVRSEIWNHLESEGGWARKKTEPGLPQRGTIERVLLIEPYSGNKSFIRFGCSIQGNIIEPILHSVRPDIETLSQQ